MENILNTIYNFFFDFENKEPFNAAQDFNVVIVGFVLVLCALLLLAFIVSLLPKIVGSGRKKKKEDKKVQEGNVAPETEIEISAAEEAEDEEELVAVLTAAIMSYYGNETKCNLKVTSFKRIDNSSNAWSNAGRRDHLDASL